jgi:phosphoserine phosphatase
MSENSPQWAATFLRTDAGESLQPLLQSALRLIRFEAEGDILPAIIAEGMAYDILWSGTATPQLRHGLTQLAEAHRVDVVVQNQAYRGKKLLLTDMDSTLIEQECIDEMAARFGLKEQVSAITERSMRGEIAFEQALIERVALLEGLPAGALQAIYDQTITLTPGAEMLIKHFKAAGGKVVLLSGGFTFFTERLAEKLGLDAHEANQLEIADGKLTGRLLPPLLGPEAKLDALRRYGKQWNITPEQTLAMGDGANDLPMLTAAGLGVAYRGKAKVQEAMREQNKAVFNHTDLRGVWWVMQGVYA